MSASGQHEQTADTSNAVVKSLESSVSLTTTTMVRTPYNKQEIYLKPHPILRPMESVSSEVSNEGLSPKPKTDLSPHFSSKGEGIPEPRPTDVICGRGKMTASHPANKRFRELVDSHKESYQNSKRRDEKTRITCELVEKLRQEGRFVLFDPTTKLWYEVSEEYAREKVSHSLRSRSTNDQRTHPPNNSGGSSHSKRHVESTISIAPRIDHQNSVTLGEGSVGSSGPTINTSLLGTNKDHSCNSSTLLANASNPSSSPSKKLSSSRSKRVAKTTSSAFKAQSTGAKSKHSLLQPGLDDVVKRLIMDQQELLRGMIQKEKERFSSSHGTSPTAIGLTPQLPPQHATTIRAEDATAIESSSPYSTAVKAPVAVSESSSTMNEDTEPGAIVETTTRDTTSTTTPTTVSAM